MASCPDGVRESSLSKPVAICAEGRDKATKLAQYSLRFLAWTASGNKETAAHMNALSSERRLRHGRKRLVHAPIFDTHFLSLFVGASGEARQIFRLGKFIPESMALLKACETEPSEEKEKRRIWVGF